MFSLQSSEERPEFIKTKCLNLEVTNYRDEDGVRYIKVRCKLSYMTRHGCPRDCQGYKGPELTGAGTFIGVLLGESIGTVAGATLGGLCGAVMEVGGKLTRFEELVNEARSKRLRVIVVPLINHHSLR